MINVRHSISLTKGTLHYLQQKEKPNKHVFVRFKTINKRHENFKLQFL